MSLMYAQESSTYEPFSLPRLCNACGNSGVSRCPRCLYVWYCSIACQYQDRESHNQLCHLYAGQSSNAESHPAEYYHKPSFILDRPDSISPQPEYLAWPLLPDTPLVRALVLPAGSARHYYEYVELTGYSSPAGTVRWVPNLSPILGGYLPSTNNICTRGVGNKLLRYPLHFFFEVPPDARVDAKYLKPNDSANRLAESSLRLWRGAMVVLRFNGAKRRGYQSVEMADIWNVKTYLREH